MRLAAREERATRSGPISHAIAFYGISVSYSRNSLFFYGQNRQNGRVKSKKSRLTKKSVWAYGFIQRNSVPDPMDTEKKVREGRPDHYIVTTVAAALIGLAKVIAGGGLLRSLFGP